MSKILIDETTVMLAIDALTIADNIALIGSAYTPKSIAAGLLKMRDAATALKALAEQPAQQEPLTYQEIWDAIRPLATSNEVCAAIIVVSMDEYRAIEAAHNIKEKT